MKLFSLFNIPVYIHWSLPLMFIFVALVEISQLLDFLIVFLFVVPHEYGHALMARKFGINTKGIIMLPFGGLALLDGMSRKPKEEMLIAIAGPLVNLVLFFLFLPIFLIFPCYFTILICLANLILFAFNVFPCYPMDGGRIFRAFLACFCDFKNATYFAVRISQIISLFLIITGIYFGSPLLAVTMVIIMFLAELELKQVEMIDDNAVD